MQNTIIKTDKKTNYLQSDTNICFYLEKLLQNLFQEEMACQNSIFKKVNPNAIHKMALFMSGKINRACSIGIAGETASGKSTITYDIINTIQNYAEQAGINNAITRINTDDYYYDRSEMVKKAGSFSEFAKHYDLDVPEALELELMKKHIKSLLDGEVVMLPEYDMSGTAIRKDNAKIALPSKIVISEGLFTLTSKVVDAFDFKVYVDVSHEVQKERFYKRAEERGLGDSAHEVYENASSKAKTHIHPTAVKADIILSGEADRSAYRNFINKIIDLLKEIH